MTKATAKKVAVKKPGSVRAVSRAVELAESSAGRVTVKVNQAARVKAGKYADLVGIVQEISEDGERAKLLIQGVQADDSVDALEWFTAGEVEANQ